MGDRRTALNASNASRLANREWLATLPRWKCAHCGLEKPATVHQRRQTYCSKPCMAAAYKARMVGDRNPNYRAASKRVCPRCGTEFESYTSTFCSHACYSRCDGQIVIRAGHDPMKWAARRDANHAEIVEAMRKECPVYDLSGSGNGVPDCLAWIKSNSWQLFDIKNPKSRYGKSGLNPVQKRWLYRWRGGPVFLIYTVEEAVKLANGDFDGLKFEVGNTEQWNAL